MKDITRRLFDSALQRTTLPEFEGMLLSPSFHVLRHALTLTVEKLQGQLAQEDTPHEIYRRQGALKALESFDTILSDIKGELARVQRLDEDEKDEKG